MASTARAASNCGRVFDKICFKLGWSRGSLGGIKKKAKWVSDGAPTALQADYLTYPVKAGDLAYDTTGKAGYICTVSVAVATDATFVKLHA